MENLGPVITIHTYTNPRIKVHVKNEPLLSHLFVNDPRWLLMPRLAARVPRPLFHQHQTALLSLLQDSRG